MAPKFYIGMHSVKDSGEFDRAFVSVNRLWQRKSAVPCREWIMDSGSFTEVSRREKMAWCGGAVARYAEEIERQAKLNGGALLAAVAPDLMCEPEMIRKVGIGQQSARVHIGITIHNYVRVMEHFGFNPPCHIMPVLQGYAPADYVYAIGQYGPNLQQGAWVGVGSVCKRNADPESVAAVLRAIHAARPDLKLHGFGVKFTALQNAEVRKHLHSCDSMAWSFAARYEGRNGNDVNEAHSYLSRVHNILTEAA